MNRPALPHRSLVLALLAAACGGGEPASTPPDKAAPAVPAAPQGPQPIEVDAALSYSSPQGAALGDPATTYSQWQPGSLLMVGVDGANLRAQASAEAEVVTTLDMLAPVMVLEASSETVELIGRANRWYRIRSLDGAQEGHLFGSILTPLGGEADLDGDGEKERWALGFGRELEPLVRMLEPGLSDDRVAALSVPMALEGARGGTMTVAAATIGATTLLEVSLCQGTEACKKERVAYQAAARGQLGDLLLPSSQLRPQYVYDYEQDRFHYYPPDIRYLGCSRVNISQYQDYNRFHYQQGRIYEEYSLGNRSGTITSTLDAQGYVTRAEKILRPNQDFTSKFENSYDAQGRLIERKGRVGGTGQEIHYQLAYDRKGRVSKRTQPTSIGDRGMSCEGAIVSTYSYDSQDNILDVEVVDRSHCEYIDSGGNKTTGDPTSRTTHSHSYDEQGRLTKSVRESEQRDGTTDRREVLYRYDDEGRLMKVDPQDGSWSIVFTRTEDGKVKSYDTFRKVWRISYPDC